MNRINYDIAFSCTNCEHIWMVSDLYALLSDLSYNIYFYKDKPDSVRHEAEIQKVYNNSIINVLFLCGHYIENLKSHSNNLLQQEYNVLINRHNNEKNKNRLIILELEPSLECNDWKMIRHNIWEIGIFRSKTIIINRHTEYLTFNVDNYSYKHPNIPDYIRSTMKPCKFRISRNFKNDRLRRWKRLGDINVEVITGGTFSSTLKVYLIPSGSVPPYISHSHILKTEKNALITKQRLGEKFAEKFRDEILTGVIFDINFRGFKYPHIYSEMYDEFLMQNWISARNE